MPARKLKQCVYTSPLPLDVHLDGVLVLALDVVEGERAEDAVEEEHEEQEDVREPPLAPGADLSERLLLVSASCGRILYFKTKRNNATFLLYPT